MLVLFQVVLPVFLVFAIGFIGQKVFSLDVKSISTVALYLMAPAMAFETFYKTPLGGTYLHILTYGILLTAIIIILVKGLAIFGKYDSSTTSALILGSAFMNNGNMGMPIILFAFGEEGFRYAVTIMIIHLILMSTVGIYYAAKGRSDIKQSLLSVAKMPIIYGSIAGLLWQYLQLPLSGNIFQAIQMVSSATIPTVMLVLGMQLAEIKPVGIQWDKTILALLTRLIVSPLIAWGIVLLLPVSPLLGKVMIAEAAMPAGAITTMYALHYDSRPDLVSSITLLSTILSILTVSIMLNILM